MTPAPQPIVISSNMPLGLRLGLAGGALVLSAILLHDLLPGLWPPTMATPIIGLIVAGGLLVLTSLFAATLLGPDVTWTVTSDAIEIRRALFGREDRVSLDGARFAARVVADEDTEGPATWHLHLEPKDEAAATLLRRLHQPLWLPSLGIRLSRKAACNGLRSPAFANRRVAEAALILFQPGADRV